MIFSEKYGKMSKKVKNDEKGWYIDEKGQNWSKMEKYFFVIFSEKYGKMSKKVKNGEKGWYIDEKGQNW